MQKAASVDRVPLIFLLIICNITLIIDVFRHLNANCRRFYALFVLIFPTQSLCLCLYLRFLMSGSSPPTGILSLWFLLPHWYFFSLSTENANFRLITWWKGFEERVLYISVLRKPHSMLSLSPLLCSNEQQTLSRYQMWKDCPIFLDVLFCRPAALDDNRLPSLVTIITETWVT